MGKPLVAILLVIGISKITIAQTTFQKTYDAGGDDVANCVQQTNDGGYIMAGYTTSGLSGLNSNVLLMKTDSNGNLLWNKTYGGIDEQEATWIQQTADSGYIICGFAGDLSIGLLIKTNQAGDTVWTKTYYSLINYFNYVEQTKDGGYILCGQICTTGNFGFVVKTDSLGNTVWSIGNGNDGNGQEAAGFNMVHQTNDEGYIAAGYTYDGNTNTTQAYLLKLNAEGDTIWSKDYWTDIIGAPSVINSVIQTADSGYVFAGKIASSNNVNAPYYATLVKSDQLGNVVWQQKYSAANSARQIRQINTGGYIVTLTSGVNDNEQNIYALKTDSGGNFQWCKLYQISSDIALPGSIGQTNDDGFIIAGTNIDTTGDVYLIKTDSNGISNCNETPILISSGNPFYIIGGAIESNYIMYDSTAYFNGYATSLSYTTNALCHGDTTMGIAILHKDNSLSIFPNPTNGQFTILFPIDHSEIMVTDMLGQEVIKTEATQGATNLRLEQNGIYIVYVSSKEGNAIGKLVVGH